MKLRYAHWFPPNHPHTQLIDQWCKELEKRTDGRVKATHFPGATLSPIAQIYDGITKGVFEVGMFPPSYTAGRFPLSEVINLPLGYATGYQASRTSYEFYKKFRPKELDDIKVFFTYGHGPCFIHLKKPVNTLEEIKGLRIKADGLSAKIVTALGAIPMTMPINETYEALQRGIVDGMLLPNEVLKSFRFGEVAKTTVMDHGVSNTTLFVAGMNKQKFNELPKDIQEIIEKMSAEWAEKEALVFNLLDKEGADYLSTSGNTVVKVSKEDQAKTAAKMKPLFDDYVQAMQQKGLPGADALKFCQDYIKSNP